MVFKNKLTFLNGDKKPVLELELGIFKIDKMDELKTYILGLKEDQSTADIKRGLSNLYEGNELTKFSAFDGVRATLQAEKIEDPKLQTISNEKLDTQSAEIAEMQEHLEVVRFSETEDKPDLKKTVSEDVKVDKLEKTKTDTIKIPDEKESNDKGIDKSLFLKESPVSDSFKRLHKDGFKNIGKEEEIPVEATGEASNKDKDDTVSKEADKSKDIDDKDEKEELQKGVKDGRS